MKAIANSIEPKGLEPGLFPRAVRPVPGFGFEQLFTVTDISISEDTIGIDAELPATLPLDGQALPLDGQALIETGQMPVGFGVGGLQGADRILGEGAMAQTPPMATASAQENSEKAGAAAPALWLSAIEPQAAWGATDAGLIISSAPELFAKKRQVEAHSMALGAVTDAAGETPVGLGLIGPQVADRMNLAETAPMAVLSALMLSEGEPQAVLGSKDATLIAPTAPEPLSIKAELEPDEPALDAVLSAASAGDPGVVETAARARPGAEVADIVPLAMPSVERPSLDDAGVEDAGLAATRRDLPESAGKADVALTERAKTVLLMTEAETDLEPLPKPPLTALSMPLEAGEKGLDPAPTATAAQAAKHLNATVPVATLQQGKTNARDTQPAVQSTARSAREIATFADAFRAEPAQAVIERAEPPSITTAQARSFGAAPPSAPVVPTSLPAAIVLNMRQADWGRQLSGQIERMVATGSQRIEVSLRPKNLGQIQVSLELRGDQTHVHIVTETAAAARLLSGAEERLVQALDQSGYRLSGFTAQEQGTGAQGGHAGQQGQQGQPSPRRSRTAPDETKREDASEATAPSPYSTDRSRSSGINMLA